MSSVLLISVCLSVCLSPSAKCSSSRKHVRAAANTTKQRCSSSVPNSNDPSKKQIEPRPRQRQRWMSRSHREVKTQVGEAAILVLLRRGGSHLCDLSSRRCEAWRDDVDEVQDAHRASQRQLLWTMHAQVRKDRAESSCHWWYGLRTVDRGQQTQWNHFAFAISGAFPLAHDCQVYHQNSSR